MRLLFIAISSLFLFACASNALNKNPALSQWQGENIMKLTEQWGKPSRITTALNGNWQYVYISSSKRRLSPETTRTQTIATPKGTIGVNVPTHPVGATIAMQCTTTFEVNPRNLIMSVREEGLGCSQ